MTQPKTDDIVTRLRDMSFGNEIMLRDEATIHEAADEIERLRADVARLGSFLHPVGAVIDDITLRHILRHGLGEGKRAADEIERLRLAGDALAHGVRTGQWDEALDAWTELRGE